MIHDYRDKGAYRWLWVERNRLLMLLTNTELRTLLVLMPGLVMVELGSWLTALTGGWWRYKGLAYAQVAARPVWIMQQRRQIRALRSVSDGEIFKQLRFELDTPGRALPTHIKVVNRIFGAYAAWAKGAIART